MRHRETSLALCFAAAACHVGAPSEPPGVSATAASSHLDARASGPTATAGFLEVPPRDVTVHGAPVHIGATARMFFNLRPADVDAEGRPVIFAFNGYAAEIVRAFGTGPTTVAPGGDVVANPTSLTRVANLVYLEPRQSGYSYDVGAGGPASAPTDADCSPAVFNEYVDAADVLLAALTFLDAHRELRGPVYWLGESFAGVRITWILTYLRGRWENVPYDDPTLRATIAASGRSTSLFAGQILLEAWLAAGPEADAIAGVYADPGLAKLVAAESDAGSACAGDGACACAAQLDRSAYNFGFTVEEEDARARSVRGAHRPWARGRAPRGPADGHPAAREGRACRRVQVPRARRHRPRPEPDRRRIRPPPRRSGVLGPVLAAAARQGVRRGHAGLAHAPARGARLRRQPPRHPRVPDAGRARPRRPHERAHPGAPGRHRGRSSRRHRAGPAGRRLP